MKGHRARKCEESKDIEQEMTRKAATQPTLYRSVSSLICCHISMYVWAWALAAAPVHAILVGVLSNEVELHHPTLNQCLGLLLFTHITVQDNQISC